MTRKTLLDQSHAQEPSAGHPTASSQYAQALAKLEQVVLEGLRHGHFECSVACELINGKKRRLVIKAGKSHQYIIPPEELDSA